AGARAQDAPRIDPALRFALRALAAGATPLAAPDQPAARAAGGPLAARPPAADLLPGFAALAPAGPAGPPFVRALVRLGPGGEEALLRSGARLGARAGDIVTARIPLDALETIAAEPAVHRIEAAAALRPIGLADLERVRRVSAGEAGGLHRASPFRLAPASAMANDLGAEDIRVEPLRQLVDGRFVGVAGQGVIIGVYDTGLDLTH